MNIQMFNTFFSEIKAEEREQETTRPRGIRDLPLPPIIDMPEPEPEAKPRRLPQPKKDEAPKFKRPKYDCLSYDFNCLESFFFYFM